jgi:hypothetical protein
VTTTGIRLHARQSGGHSESVGWRVATTSGQEGPAQTGAPRDGAEVDRALPAGGRGELAAPARARA